MKRLTKPGILIVRAYVGFELAPLPASKVENPRKVNPKAIILGMNLNERVVRRGLPSITQVSVVSC